MLEIMEVVNEVDNMDVLNLLYLVKNMYKDYTVYICGDQGVHHLHADKVGNINHVVLTKLWNGW